MKKDNIPQSPIRNPKLLLLEYDEFVPNSRPASGLNM
jgi:hypothetical protein